MSNQTFEAEASAAWDGLLVQYRPPEAPDDWASRSMWPLVQAAASVPRLRSLYPWTSHSSLNFSLSQSFRDWGTEGFPGIHAGPGLYSVLAFPWRDNRVLLATADSTEAVTFVDQWFRDNAAGQEPGRRSEE
ncbi:DUF6193 family natural product biosynthesis protein [Streptomyces sp. NBC_01431]|uniref:DUF6193 family natural product biosynthesis protein n=1 Tax=Streptomyces sp. NBC_01431 TaxID=2903863 RepID=UPI002E2FB660|nr:DUF6193 family natural product biosynthesis protein [Streptomyces sp. NBC_01431]